MSHTGTGYLRACGFFVVIEPTRYACFECGYGCWVMLDPPMSPDSLIALGRSAAWIVCLVGVVYYGTHCYERRKRCQGM